MPKPTSMTGWWLRLLQRSGGTVRTLAALLDVNVRTVHRWQIGDMEPTRVKRDAIRAIAGPDLVNDPNIPRYLKLKKSANAQNTTSSKHTVDTNPMPPIHQRNVSKQKVVVQVPPIGKHKTRTHG